MQSVLYGPNGLPLNPQTPAIVDPTFYALRTSPRPYEYNLPGLVAGHYSAVVATAAIAPAANAILGAFRFAPASGSPVAMLMRLRAHVNIISAITAQRIDALGAFMARGYTTADATNATNLVLTGNNAKRRTAMGTPLAVISAASAAAGMSAGVKAVDANPFGICPLNINATPLTTANSGIPIADIYKNDNNGGHPPTMVPFEGVLVQWGATALATGTVIVTLEFDWTEALQF